MGWPSRRVETPLVAGGPQLEVATLDPIEQEQTHQHLLVQHCLELVARELRAQRGSPDPAPQPNKQVAKRTAGRGAEPDNYRSEHLKRPVKLQPRSEKKSLAGQRCRFSCDGLRGKLLGGRESHFAPSQAMLTSAPGPPRPPHIMYRHARSVAVKLLAMKEEQSLGQLPAPLNLRRATRQLH